ncbi:3-phenylpropionate MFS transporter [Vibrio sp. SM6]|uniref:3-phenylpropionate MFS transporter n=1 Tax=Vibrio agarilyticus TaxID=2726741 RepID=A0A7X8YHD5_9VIBR|nr:3-phenylpropionate MFS transporter [Vibrio agarilyticus]NLS13988.1 3-phenylpropionate MFS transporter [Vibrio agarilyticus]
MFSPSPYGWIAQYLIGFFFAYGVYLPFWSLWLEAQNVNAADIGLLLGLGLAARCVANLFITPRFHRPDAILPALRILSAGAFLFITLHFFTTSSLWLMGAAIVLFNLCCGPIVPLSDALANYYARLKMLDYGRTRLWGSVAFVAGSTVVGYLVSRYGANMILITALVGVAFSIVIGLLNPTPRPTSHANAAQARPNLLHLMRENSVWRFLALMALIQGSHAAYYAFSALYWKQSGHSEEIIGFLWSLGVVAEVVVFAFSRRWFGRFSLRSLFIVASLGVALRWGLTASTTVLPALILVQLLHGITFAMAHIAAIRYIQSAPENRMVALQALYNALPLGGFIALMTTLSGIGYELWGANVFWAMAAMGIMALVIKLPPATDMTQSTKERGASA